MSEDGKVMCVTGHRPSKLGGYDINAQATLVTSAIAALNHYSPGHIKTGMALGWDQAIAEACVFCKIPFTAVVPFIGQENKWPSKAQEHYRWLLSKAAEVVVVCEGGYAPWKLQKRNEWLVDHSEEVLAMWDGSAGGTANCIKYAEGKKPVHNVFPNWNSRDTNTCNL